MNFGQAISALKLGKSVAREGWNGKGMYVVLVKSSSPPLTEPYLCIHTTQQTKQPGWLATQADILAEDWMIVSDPPLKKGRNRHRLDLNTPEELLIYEAMVEIEKLGAHTLLTSTTALLSEARGTLSEWVDLQIEK